MPVLQVPSSTPAITVRSVEKLVALLEEAGVNLSLWGLDSFEPPLLPVLGQTRSARSQEDSAERTPQGDALIRQLYRELKDDKTLVPTVNSFQLNSALWILHIHYGPWVLVHTHSQFKYGDARVKGALPKAVKRTAQKLSDLVVEVLCSSLCMDKQLASRCFAMRASRDLKETLEPSKQYIGIMECHKETWLTIDIAEEFAHFVPGLPGGHPFYMSGASDSAAYGETIGEFWAWHDTSLVLSMNDPHFAAMSPQPHTRTEQQKPTRRQKKVQARAHHQGHELAEDDEAEANRERKKRLYPLVRSDEKIETGARSLNLGERLALAVSMGPAFALIATALEVNDVTKSVRAVLRCLPDCSVVTLLVFLPEKKSFVEDFVLVQLEFNADPAESLKQAESQWQLHDILEHLAARPLRKVAIDRGTGAAVSVFALDAACWELPEIAAMRRFNRDTRDAVMPSATLENVVRAWLTWPYDERHSPANSYDSPRVPRAVNLEVPKRGKGFTCLDGFCGPLMEEMTKALPRMIARICGPNGALTRLAMQAERSDNNLLHIYAPQDILQQFATGPDPGFPGLEDHCAFGASLQHILDSLLLTPRGDVGISGSSSRHSTKSSSRQFFSESSDGDSRPGHARPQTECEQSVDALYELLCAFEDFQRDRARVWKFGGPLCCISHGGLSASNILVDVSGAAWLVGGTQVDVRPVMADVAYLAVSLLLDGCVIPVSLGQLHKILAFERMTDMHLARWLRVPLDVAKAVRTIVSSKRELSDEGALSVVRLEDMFAEVLEAAVIAAPNLLRHEVVAALKAQIVKSTVDALAVLEDAFALADVWARELDPLRGPDKVPPTSVLRDHWKQAWELQSAVLHSATEAYSQTLSVRQRLHQDVPFRSVDTSPLLLQLPVLQCLLEAISDQWLSPWQKLWAQRLVARVAESMADVLMSNKNATPSAALNKTAAAARYLDSVCFASEHRALIVNEATADTTGQTSTPWTSTAQSKSSTKDEDRLLIEGAGSDVVDGVYMRRASGSAELSDICEAIGSPNSITLQLLFGGGERTPKASEDQPIAFENFVAGRRPGQTEKLPIGITISHGFVQDSSSYKGVVMNDNPRLQHNILLGWPCAVSGVGMEDVRRMSILEISRKSLSEDLMNFPAKAAAADALYKARVQHKNGHKAYGQYEVLSLSPALRRAQIKHITASGDAHARGVEGRADSSGSRSRSDERSCMGSQDSEENSDSKGEEDDEENAESSERRDEDEDASNGSDVEGTPGDEEFTLGAVEQAVGLEMLLEDGLPRIGITMLGHHIGWAQLGERVVLPCRRNEKHTVVRQTAQEAYRSFPCAKCKRQLDFLPEGGDDDDAALHCAKCWEKGRRYDLCLDCAETQAPLCPHHHATNLTRKTPYDGEPSCHVCFKKIRQIPNPWTLSSFEEEKEVWFHCRICPESVCDDCAVVTCPKRHRLHNMRVPASTFLGSCAFCKTGATAKHDLDAYNCIPCQASRCEVAYPTVRDAKQDIQLNSVVSPTMSPGFVVASVKPGGAAQVAGVKQGHRLSHVNGRRVAGNPDRAFEGLNVLTQCVASFAGPLVEVCYDSASAVRSDVTLTVVRGAVMERSPPRQSLATNRHRSTVPNVSNADEAPTGLMLIATKVTTGGIAATAGVARGCCLVTVNGRDPTGELSWNGATPLDRVTRIRAPYVLSFYPKADEVLLHRGCSIWCSKGHHMEPQYDMMTLHCHKGHLMSRATGVEIAQAGIRLYCDGCGDSLPGLNCIQGSCLICKTCNGMAEMELAGLNKRWTTAGAITLCAKWGRLNKAEVGSASISEGMGMSEKLPFRRSSRAIKERRDRFVRKRSTLVRRKSFTAEEIEEESDASSQSGFSSEDVDDVDDNVDFARVVNLCWWCAIEAWDAEHMDRPFRRHGEVTCVDCGRSDLAEVERRHRLTFTAEPRPRYSGDAGDSRRSSLDVEAAQPSAAVCSSSTVKVLDRCSIISTGSREAAQAQHVDTLYHCIECWFSSGTKYDLCLRCAEHHRSCDTGAKHRMQRVTSSPYTMVAQCSICQRYIAEDEEVYHCRDCWFSSKAIRSDRCWECATRTRLVYALDNSNRFVLLCPDASDPKGDALPPLQPLEPTVKVHVGPEGRLGIDVYVQLRLRGFVYPVGARLEVLTDGREVTVEDVHPTGKYSVRVDGCRARTSLCDMSSADAGVAFSGRLEMCRARTDLFEPDVTNHFPVGVWRYAVGQELMLCTSSGWMDVQVKDVDPQGNGHYVEGKVSYLEDDAGKPTTMQKTWHVDLGTSNHSPAWLAQEAWNREKRNWDADVLSRSCFADSIKGAPVDLMEVLFCVRGGEKTCFRSRALYRGAKAAKMEVSPKLEASADSSAKNTNSISKSRHCSKPPGGTQSPDRKARGSVAGGVPVTPRPDAGNTDISATADDANKWPSLVSLAKGPLHRHDGFTSGQGALIIGGPSSGKTLLLRRLAVEASRNAGEMVPIMADALALIRVLGSPSGRRRLLTVGDFLAVFLRSEYGFGNVFLKQAVYARRVVLLVDRLELLAPEELEQLLIGFARLVDIGHRVVATVRPEAFDAWEPASSSDPFKLHPALQQSLETMWLEGFDSEKRHWMIRKHLQPNEDDIGRLYAGWLSTKPGTNLEAILSSPLLFSALIGSWIAQRREMKSKAGTFAQQVGAALATVHATQTLKDPAICTNMPSVDSRMCSPLHNCHLPVFGTCWSIAGDGRHGGNETFGKGVLGDNVLLPRIPYQRRTHEHRERLCETLGPVLEAIFNHAWATRWKSSLACGQNPDGTVEQLRKMLQAIAYDLERRGEKDFTVHGVLEACRGRAGMREAWHCVEPQILQGRFSLVSCCQIDDGCGHIERTFRFAHAQLQRYLASVETIENWMTRDFASVEELIDCPKDAPAEQRPAWVDSLPFLAEMMPQPLALHMKRAEKENVAMLVDFLFHSNAVNHLSYAGAGVGQNNAALVELVRACVIDQHLTHLDLSGNGLGSHGASTVCTALITHPKLTHLNLRDNHIGFKGAVGVGAFLRHCVKLQTFDLSDNTLGSDGALAVGKALRYNKPTTFISLARNNIGREVPPKFLQSIGPSPIRRVFDTRHNRSGCPDEIICEMFCEDEIVEVPAEPSPKLPAISLNNKRTSKFLKSRTSVPG